jgi:predicted amidophosphoribosyltransferase
MPSLRLTRLEFASLLSYTPREGGQTGEQSRDLMRALKYGRVTGSPPTPFSSTIASFITNNAGALEPLTSFLSPDAVLVPVPKSALWKEGSLWVPDQLANFMVKVGLGGRAARLLVRTEAITKAATSISSNRPTAIEHYRTLAVQKDLMPIPEIVLVDDVVTTGSALLGSSNRLLESYPTASIKGFAAIRTMSNPSQFKKITDPVVGSIALRSNGLCRRQP